MAKSNALDKKDAKRAAAELALQESGMAGTGRAAVEKPALDKKDAKRAAAELALQESGMAGTGRAAVENRIFEHQVLLDKYKLMRGRRFAVDVPCPFFPDIPDWNRSPVDWITIVPTFTQLNRTRLLAFMDGLCNAPPWTVYPTPVISADFATDNVSFNASSFRIDKPKIDVSELDDNELPTDSLDRKIEKRVIHETKRRKALYENKSRCLWTEEQVWQLFANAVCNKTLVSNLETAGWRMCANALPTIEALDKLKRFIKWQKTLSVGCGAAFWEWIMQNRNCDIVCTDREIWPLTFTPVQPLTAVQAVKQYSTVDILMILWPDRSGFDAHALSAFRGRKVVVLLEREDRPRRDIGSDELWHQLFHSGKWRQSMRSPVRLPYSVLDDFYPSLYFFVHI